MKQDTKKLVLIGGAALTALYAYSTMGGEDYAGMGGGGGLPMLPTIPEAGAGAVAPIVVNIPGMEPPIGWDPEVTKKTQAIVEKYESVYAPAQAALDISTRLGAPTAADVAAYGESKKGEDKITSGKPWYAPWTWDTSEAVKNYQAWATRSTERTLNISKSDKSQTADTIIAKKIETQRNRSIISRSPSGGGSGKEFGGGLSSKSGSMIRSSSTSSFSSVFKGVKGTSKTVVSRRETPTKKRRSAPGSPD